MDLKKINIGHLINTLVIDREIETSRLCNFFNCSENDVIKMYQSNSLDSEILLKWSKILKYDLFRIYSQHLILYAPSSNKNIKSKKINNLPKFRKNIYTKEIIDFILEQIENGNMSKLQVIEHYGIPKTTLYKWIIKYKQ